MGSEMCIRDRLYITDSILKKTDCASVRVSVPFISNEFFSATAWLILSKVRMKVGTDSGFMNPEN